MKTITRQYVNKKGELITKTYTYQHNYQHRVNKLTTKKGEFTKKGEELFNEMINDINDPSKIEYLQNKVNEYRMSKKVITKSQLEAMYSKNRIAIFLANMQLSLSDIIKSIKLEGIEVDESWLLNESHWDFGSETTDARILLPNGQTALFNFNYEEHTYDIAIASEV